LAELVGNLSPETVELEKEGDKLKIHCGQLKAELNGIAGEEFPGVPTLKGAEAKGAISLEKKVLEKTIGQVAVAAGSDDSRPIYTGIKLDFSPKGLRMVATDGYRLSLKTINEFDANKAKNSLIIPARAMMELERSLNFGDESEVTISAAAAEKQLIFSLGDIEIVTRLLEGDYPDFEKIIPSSFGTSIEADVDELVRAVKSAAIFARDSANIVKLDIKKDSLSVSANAPQVGGNEINVAVKKTGDTAEIAFNSRYLLEMLNLVNSERIRLEMSGPLAPGVFKIPGDSSWLHIVMPVKLQA
jgi:DNA polymerase-3 subunit beta